MTAAYALEPTGNGGPLPGEVLDRLVAGLRAHPTTIVFLGFAAGEPVGIATCFLGFSTFYAQPLLNIHDVAVLPTHRGGGVGRALLEAVEHKAQALGCCKVTLEVQENNWRARQVYERAGFVAAEYGAGDRPVAVLLEAPHQPLPGTPRKHLGEAAVLEGAEERVAGEPGAGERGAAEAAEEARRLARVRRARRVLRAQRRAARRRRGRPAAAGARRRLGQRAAAAPVEAEGAVAARRGAAPRRSSRPAR